MVNSIYSSRVDEQDSWDSDGKSSEYEGDDVRNRLCIDLWCIL